MPRKVVPKQTTTETVEERERARQEARKTFGLKDVTPTPLFFISVASKGLSFPANLLGSTLTSILVSVASKGLVGGILRLKTGKTRRLSGSAHCKGLRVLSEQKTRAGRGKKSRERRGWIVTNTKEITMKVYDVSTTLLVSVRTEP
jgi:hypothetical protein